MSADKVLLVDDEEDFTTALSQRMEARGLSVEVAKNGDEALRSVEEGAFEAVVLDLVMPGMDGIETLRRLLEKNPDLQIILLTGHATLEKGIEAIKLGALDLLEKPAKIDSLMEAIEKARANRMVLVEKRLEAKLSKILKTKGW